MQRCERLCKDKGYKHITAKMLKDMGDAETILMTSENLKSAIRDMDPLYWTNQ